MEAIPKDMLLTGFGMMLYEGDPDVLALEIAKLPAPMRPVLPVLARRGSGVPAAHPRHCNTHARLGMPLG